MNGQELDCLIKAICTQDSKFADDIGLPLKVADLRHIYITFSMASNVTSEVLAVGWQLGKMTHLDVAYVYKAVRFHYLRGVR